MSPPPEPVGRVEREVPRLETERQAEGIRPTRTGRLAVRTPKVRSTRVQVRMPV